MSTSATASAVVKCHSAINAPQAVMGSVIAICVVGALCAFLYWAYKMGG